MYFSTQKMPELNGLTLSERQQIVHMAITNLPAVKKVTLNITKIAFLTPIFLLLANIESWYLLIGLLFVGVSYPLITTPLTLTFVRPYLTQSRKEFEKSKGA
jgi:hypothetical protein